MHKGTAFFTVEECRCI